MKLAVIIGTAVIGTAFCLPAPPLMAHVSGPGDVVQDFGRAWDASDAKAIGDLFAPDADFVAADGMFAKGRSSIEAYYAAAFADGFAGSKGVGEIVRQRPLTPDVVLIDARFTIRGAHDQGGSPRADEKGLMVAVLRRHGARWRILALRERGVSTFTPFPGSR